MPHATPSADPDIDDLDRSEIIAETDGSDGLSGRWTDGAEVFCGFGGNDILAALGEDDIFLGGEGDDAVCRMCGGISTGDDGSASLLRWTR